MSDWGAGGIVFAVFMAVLLAGLALAVWALANPVTPRRDARAILDERLARGEISTDEHIRRREVLGGGARAAPRYRGVVAAVFVAVGILGGLSAAAATDFGGMGFFDMHGMMGSNGSGSTDTAPAAVPGARNIGVVADEFSFDPSEIRIRAGERVNVELDNRGDAVHTLTISRLDFEVRADGGKRASGSLTPTVPAATPSSATCPATPTPACAAHSSWKPPAERTAAHAARRGPNGKDSSGPWSGSHGGPCRRARGASLPSNASVSRQWDH